MLGKICSIAAEIYIEVEGWEVAVEETAVKILKIVFGFALIIGIHEFGHALAARLCGVPVKRFSIGIGPGFKFKNIPIVSELIISPIVIGGYVLLDDEVLAQKSALKRFLVLISGMLGNVFMAIVLFVLAGKSLLWSIIVSFQLWLGGWFIFINLLSSGKISVSESVAGPVGIAQLMAGDLLPFLAILAFINLALAMMNLLPLPPLDGGQILIVFLEKIIGKKWAAKTHKVLTIVGVALLVALLIYATHNDIFRLIHPSQNAPR